MGAHVTTASGCAWTTQESSPDVDRPQGLSYIELQDIRLGVRKRLNKEHADFGDDTAGGEHVPGGAAVLGIEDGTATIVADGTLKGHGIVWDNTSRLWCATAAAGASTTGDWTLVLLHPDKQWGGQDITWTGQQRFEAACDFSAVDISDSLDVTGRVQCGSAILVDQSADIEGALDCSVLSVDQSADFSNTSVLGDFSVKGTTKLGDCSAEQVAAAWGYATVAAGLQDGYNVAHCDKTITGKMCISFTNALANANYATAIVAHYSSAGEICIPYCFSQRTTGFYAVFLTGAGAAVDPTAYNFTVFGY